MPEPTSFRTWVAAQGLADDTEARRRRLAAIRLVDPPPPVTTATAATATGANPGYVTTAYRDELDQLAAAAEGTRNDTLNRAAFNLRRFVDSGDVAEHQLRADLTNAARAIGLEDREIQATIQSAWRGSQAKVGAAQVPEPGANIPPAYVLGDDDSVEDVEDARPLFVDIAALLAGGLPEPPKPALLQRTDGNAVFYRAKRNELYGDPGDGKTMVALAAAAAELRDGGRVVFYDLDNNGAAETVQRTLMLGAPQAALADQTRFRYCQPDDAAEMHAAVTACAEWATFAIIDCVGELLPMFGANSDRADDYTRVMRQVAAPLERGGAGVVLLDHQAKNSESRQYGAGGTMAKRRAISGASINLVGRRSFTPGQGGAAELWINKDRPGGLAQHCPPSDNGGRRRFAGTFTLDPPGPSGVAAWRVETTRAASVAIDPVVERHHAAAVKLGGPFGASELAVAANGLPATAKATDAQRKAAERAAQKLVADGRLEVVEGRTKTWRLAAEGGPE